MPMAKVDMPRTVAAVLAFAQAAAAGLGVLAVARTPEGVLDIPAIEQVGVGSLTTLVAVALAIGCAHVLTGRGSRVIVGASIVSLVISVYWTLLRPPAEGFPSFAVAYAVLPVLILGLLGLSRASAARSSGVARAPEQETANDETALPAGPPTETPSSSAGRDMLVE